MSRFADVKSARATLKTLGVHSLLADPTANPKLEKSLGIKVYSAPLHLAPANVSGFEVCPMATAGCRAACLHTAGNPVYMAGKARARIARTQAFFKARSAFFDVLCADIEAHVRAAKRKRMRPAVRLNATSDLPWEAYAVVWRGKMYRNICEAFPKVTFYDYTKRPNRAHKLPSNYSLTFSLAENNDVHALHALDGGMNVAAVFAVKRGKPLPSSYVLAGREVAVIDGDLHDYRPADPRGVIVGLRAKGRAIGDTSGFVRAV